MFGGIDATVISGWRSAAFDTPEIANQVPPAREPEVIAQTPEVIIVSEDMQQAPEVKSESVTDEPVVSQVPEEVKEAPEVASFQELTTIQTLDEVEIPEAIAHSKAFEIISKKNIALMAHDSKKTELAQFVTQHKDFLANCLTISTPSISEALHQQTGIDISQKTSSVTVGGYQSIASLVGTYLGSYFFERFFNNSVKSGKRRSTIEIMQHQPSFVSNESFNSRGGYALH